MVTYKKWFNLGLVILTILLGASTIQAFNSATHIYIAERVFPFTFDKINLYYGSIAPDISLYADIKKWPYGFCETHYKFIKLPYRWWNINEKAFAQGWQTHNEIWGADSYAHGTCKNFGNCCVMNCNYTGYVNLKAQELAKIEKFKEYLDQPPYYELAHFAIEVAIDLLLVDEKDPDLGKKLLKAALFRSPADFNLMTKVFVGRGDGYGTDLETLSSAESTFRNLVIKYAFALTLPKDLRKAVLGQLGVEIAKGMEVEIDSATVQEIIQTAVELCQSDYYEPIQSAIEGIKIRKDLIE